MRRTMLKSKIQKAVVRQAQLDYEGSLGLDGALMDAADMSNTRKFTSMMSRTANASRPT